MKYETVKQSIFKRRISKKALIMAAIGLVAVSGVWYARPSPKAEADKGADEMDLSGLVVASAHAEVLPAKSPHLVRYISIDEAPHSEQKALRRQLHLLQKTGSLSGGALTVEFKQATHAKMTYRFGRRQALSFEPVALSLDGFVLTGRQYEGVKGEQGFDGLYRLFENPTTKARVELLETKILADDPVVLYGEFVNKTIGTTSVIFETLTDKKGIRHHNARFVHHDKLYVMSAKGVAEQDLDALIMNIVQE